MFNFHDSFSECSHHRVLYIRHTGEKNDRRRPRLRWGAGFFGPSVGGMGLGGYAGIGWKGARDTGLEAAELRRFTGRSMYCIGSEWMVEGSWRTCLRVFLQRTNCDLLCWLRAVIRIKKGMGNSSDGQLSCTDALASFWFPEATKRTGPYRRLTSQAPSDGSRLPDSSWDGFVRRIRLGIGGTGSARTLPIGAYGQPECECIIPLPANLHLSVGLSQSKANQLFVSNQLHPTTNCVKFEPTPQSEQPYGE